MNVSMTGFTCDPKEEDYIRTLPKLQLNFSPSLDENTSVLIAKDASSEKFKIARARANSLAVVTIDWLLDSYLEQQVLDPSKYLVTATFYGVEVVILHNNEPVCTQGKALIEEQGGKAQCIHSVKELLALSQ